MIHLRSTLASSAALLLLTQSAAPEVHNVCPSDEEDVHGLLQQSILARAGDRDMQLPDAQGANQGGLGADIRTQVRALGGLCGQDAAGRCPAECPLTARDLSTSASGGATFCTFACVPATEAACVAYSPGEPIPDEKLGICRAAARSGCEEFVVPSATMTVSEMERCTVCSSGYNVLEDGTCQSMYRYIWYSLFLVIGLFVAAVGAWLVDLAARPIINNAGLEHGLATRSRAKIHTPKVLTSADGSTPRLGEGSNSGRQLWPLSTNLCSTMVAGPGLTLHFNYMAMIILWASVIMIAWIAFAYLADGGEGTLFELGTRVATTPAETCAVVDWGYEMQQRLMGAKAVFVAGCYVWSFALFVLFSFYQKRLLQNLDTGATTHMDFCAVVEGLPSMSGDGKVEDELCEEIEKTTGQKPVGVSIAWEMGELHQELMNTIDENLDALHNEEMAKTGGDSGAMRCSNIRKTQTEEAMSKTLSKGGRKHSDGRKSLKGARASIKHTQRMTQQTQTNLFRKMLMQIERGWLTPTTQKLITKGKRRDFEGRHTDDAEFDEDFEVDEELLAMRSCSTAYAIFKSEEARDAAVKKVTKTGGMSFRNFAVTMKPAQHEPQAVIWTNFKDQHTGWKVLRCIIGSLAIILALCLWTLVFYLPYAYYAMSFNYGQGQWPGMLKETMFVIVIVFGNASMYYLCSAVADFCSFRYAGDRELCYTLLYYVSCLLNVILDMICAYNVVFMALVGVGSRTHDGVLLTDLTSFTARFEAYPVQLDLGWTVFAYAFPCTFLLPFIAEPIATIAMPYKIMTAIVGYRNDVQGSRADTFLACTPMDLSRYTDIALNVVLATLVFWFPSGITLMMFGSCALSHMYIFCYDHYRVLRAVPAFSISGMRTDWWAQVMLTVPCGLLLSCALYKSNCVEGFESFHPTGVLSHVSHDIFGHCKEGEMLVLKCVAACVMHVIVHFVILSVVVPLLGGNFIKQPTKTSYSECARRNAHSYFSVNPVHCLRSEYFYEHEPPFVFSRPGKEHLMPQNIDIGAYFSDTSAMTEDYSSTVETFQELKRLQSSSSTTFCPSK